MHMSNPYSKELLKCTLSAIILSMPAEEDKMYGYQISQRVKELSDERILVKEGSLYPALHKLEADGAIEVETVYVGKRMRRYYRLTAEGKAAKTEKLKEIVSFMSTLSKMLFLNAEKTCTMSLLKQ